jgi:mRNA-degrading endonuclease RelE of RelBE toxin-antitoxin system
MNYKIFLSDDALGFLRSLDIKSKNICKKNLEKLSSPYPGRGIGALVVKKGIGFT